MLTKGIVAACTALLAAALHGAALGVEDLLDLEFGTSTFEGEVAMEVATAYLASSGILCDTRPVSTQEFDWQFDFGPYGRLFGYGWFTSSLHSRQHAAHREPLNEFEGAVHYGKEWRFTDALALESHAGPLWNPQIGYRHSTDSIWGPNFGQTFSNPYLSPYWSALWIVNPATRLRIRFGVRRTFRLFESFAVTPDVEAVWVDGHRYRLRYGDDPRHPILGGSFIALTSGVKLEWRVAKGWRLYAKLRQFDTIDRQTRRIVKGWSAYYARRDQPIAALGVACDF